MDFLPSKSQKRVIRNMNKYLIDGVKPKYYSKDEDRGSSKASQEVSSDAKELVQSKSDQSKERKCQRTKETQNKRKKIRIEKAISKVMKKNDCDHETARKVAKEKHEMKVKKRIQSKVKPLEELLKLPDDGKEPAHKLQVKFVSTSFVHNKPKEGEYMESSLPTEHSLYAKYQTEVHGDDPNECTRKQFQRFLVDSPLIPIVSFFSHDF